MLENPRSPRVRAVAKLTKRSARQETGLFLLEGPQAAREALAFRPDTLVEVFATPSAMERHQDSRDGAKDAGVEIVLTTEAVLDAMADTVTPQGIVARCRVVDMPFDSLLAQQPRLIAVPVDVRDPGNAGTIVRCADAAGAGGVVLAGDSVDLYNPKTVRASAGSIFHLPVARSDDPAAVVRAIQAAGLQVIATEGEAVADLDDVIDSGRLAAPTAWLFGNEAHGLPDEVAELADLRVRIPIRGLAESLNLSTAAAICLFASARAHR